jgi:hypothetical protein
MPAASCVGCIEHEPKATFSDVYVGIGNSVLTADNILAAAAAAAAASRWL